MAIDFLADATLLASFFFAAAFVGAVALTDLAKCGARRGVVPGQHARGVVTGAERVGDGGGRGPVGGLDHGGGDVGSFFFADFRRTDVGATLTWGFALALVETEETFSPEAQAAEAGAAPRAVMPTVMPEIRTGAATRAAS